MSSYGKNLRLTSYGESHSSSVGGILEGFPANYSVDITKIQKQLDRRRAKGSISTARQELDKIEIHSGLKETGESLGTPIGFLVKNKDIKPEDYKKSQGEGENYIPRPSHADYTYLMKYGIHASSGGGRSSARETISRVVGGSIAEQYLESKYNCTIVAWVSKIGNIEMLDRNEKITREMVDISPVKCPDAELSILMENEIHLCKEQQDSIGGIVNIKIYNPPIGIGEPCFDKLEAMLAHGMMSIPASKGFEIGEGFKVASLRGSENNDNFKCEYGNKIKPASNHAGGILGGISSGETINMRIAFKPPSSISLPQETVSLNGSPITLEMKGRHDPCIVHRAIPVVEAMAALTILDMTLGNTGK